ncbi:MAG: collagen binding domain-containing protein [Pyrinomonadaceae bacterium]
MKYLLPFILLFTLTAIGQQSPEPAPTPILARSTLRARVFYEMTGRPVKRTSVLLMSQGSGPAEASGITDASGNLVIENLSAGKYYAVVNAPGAVSPLAYIDLRRARSESFEEQLAPFPAIIVNGISDIDTVIPVKTGGAIGGRIAYADGDPAIGVKVEILRKVEDEFLPTVPNLSAFAQMMFGGAGGFQTDDRGQYRFAGLPPGQYLVKVTEQVIHPTRSENSNRFGIETLLFGSGSMINVYFQDVFEEDKAQLLKVDFGQELSEINITIPDRRLYTLEGKLVAEKDKLPIRNARIALTREGDEVVEQPEYGPRRNINVAYTDDQGNWKFVELPKGKYKVSAQAVSSEFDEVDKAYGSRPISPDDYGYAANVVANAANAISNAVNGARYGNANGPQKPPAPKFSKKSQEFVIEDKDLAEQVIELNIGAVISGTVTVEGGQSLPGSVTITASDESGEATISESVSSYDYSEESGVIASKSKDFAIDGISAGKVYLTVRSADDEYYVKSVSAGGADLIKGPVEMKTGENLARVKVVLAKGTGKLEVMIENDDKRPVIGLELTFVPTDPSKLRNASYYRSARSNAEGLIKLDLPPFEYAAVIVPKRPGGRRDHFVNWLLEAVKKAQTFKIEAGKTAKGTIRSGPKS